jgi:hypothetical protein
LRLRLPQRGQYAGATFSVAVVIQASTMAKNAMVLRHATGLVTLADYGPELVFAPGEPYFAEPDVERPQSIWSAIHAMRVKQPERWRAMARDLYDLRRKCDADKVMVEGVLFKIKEANRCEGTDPVRVFIDPEGRYWVEVYGARPLAARKRRRGTGRRRASPTPR